MTQPDTLQWAWRLLAVACVLVAAWKLAPVQPLEEQGPDAHRYAETARSLVTGEGYVNARGDRPRYPPGLPVVLAPLAAVGEAPGRVAVFPVLAGLTLLGLMAWAAWSLAGPAAAAVAMALVMASPGVTFATSEVMSDLPAASLIVAALLAVIHRRPVLAGVLVGLSATMRLGHALFALTGDRRRLGGSVLVLAPLAVVQTLLYGGPLGYSSEQADLSARWLTERPILGITGDWSPHRNFELYPQLLMGRWGWIVPGLPLAAGAELWLRRREPAARFAATVIVLNVLLYLAFFYQAYRFMLPAAVLLIVFSAALAGRGLDRLRQWDDTRDRTATADVADPGPALR